MKLFKRLLVLATLFSFFCTFDGNAATNGNAPSVPLRKERKDKGHNNDLDEEGKRSPSRPMMAYFDPDDGFIVSGVDDNDIVSYEAYDENKVCIGIFYDNMQFSSFVLSQTGLIEIRVELDEYLLIGFLEI